MLRVQLCRRWCVHLHDKAPEKSPGLVRTSRPVRAEPSLLEPPWAHTLLVEVLDEVRLPVNLSQNGYG
eukprot:12351201-Prorocentrum_lima.AAC.1